MAAAIYFLYLISLKSTITTFDMEHSKIFYSTLAVGPIIITGLTGMIQSPLFPEKYPHDRTKIWIIRGPRPGKIRIHFMHFDLEYHNECRYDFVEIRDGSEANAESVGRFCGKTLPASFESSGNGLWLKFRSDSSSHASGFMAKWSWVESSKNKNTDSEIATNEKKDTGEACKFFQKFCCARI